MVVLSAKRAEQRVHFIDAARLPNHKTKDLVNRLNYFGNPEQRTVLIHGDGELDPNFVIASRNIPNLDLIPARGANVLDLVSARTVIVTLSAKMDLESRLMRRSRRVHIDNRLIRLAPTAAIGAVRRARAVARIAAVKAFNKVRSKARLEAKKRKAREWIDYVVARRKAKGKENDPFKTRPTTAAEKAAAVAAAAALIQPVTVVAAEPTATA